MVQHEWFLHMDRNWMWRWFLTNDRGQAFAMSKDGFFTRDEAVQNRDAARMVVIGL
ncbi:MAG: hypothetical protein NDI74_05700 [Sphingomonas sp.]|jgi:hypothetical protein|uniref:hypothetical protein n=1 Tax=Sphingomonas TaxID=13687 RepID=UPI000367DA1A|nr:MULTISPECIES: hypothetical protein [Sphingomonas]MBX8844442.1 hypothetical protein [Sphingomonas melonis]MBX8852457.1 hypothetical protein [Sphingomonas melonis]MBX8897784.1 hypothetical protein [Sphingomonas melonis]MCM2298907.1 hypothetical protein [Sphingomonas sp.]